MGSKGHSYRDYDVGFYLPAVGALLDRNAMLPAPGGAETQILLLSTALAGQGFRVCLYASDVPGGDMPTSIDGVDVVLRPPYGRRGLIGHVLEARLTARTLRKWRAKVVVSRTASFEVGLVGIFARFAGSRFVFSSANVSDFDFARLAPKLKDRLLYRLGVRLAHAIVVQTPEQKVLCRNAFRRDAFVIKSLVEADVPRRAEPEAFLWAARAVWYKRPFAFLELARSCPGAQFWMVPVPSPEDDALMIQIREAAQRIPNVRVFDPQSPSDLMSLVRCAVAIVNTSDFEGMPNVSLEGWARGVPTLALSHDPDGVIVRHGLGRFAGGSFERFVSDAATLWNERGSSESLALRCQRYVATEHSPPQITAQWSRVIAALASRNAVGKAEG
jgi:hypothetical protein